ncbi:cryptococcal mannosyltransferase 1-domain-containing protein [Auriculariales sp. MPI-PUGE-AT-0066]|nr:cryptococcal mannosyltransferase 1-domain-containing protein [Auriculariales sp. MPI-PUGE-AT-0066]
MAGFSVTVRRRTLTRVGLVALLLVLLRMIFGGNSGRKQEIYAPNVLDYVTRPDKVLDVHKHAFLQSRIGRDERPDLMSSVVRNGVVDFWTRFQLPFIQNKVTSHMDSQIVRSAIDDLLSLNGWVAAACPTLMRPFGQNKRDDNYDDLARQDHLYYIAIVIHSADHFLVDQLAVIVQMAKRLGTHSLFVSMLDYDSTDATPTLVDLCEAVLTMLGIAFRIRRVPGMTEDPTASYYPLEEAYARNLALEPLLELYNKRKVIFNRVIWLKGFTCPNDILETIKVSQLNDAAMVCGMDWAEHNGFFIFSDRWRTRDMDGDQFRQSKSSSRPEAGPPRDKNGAARYALHLPFQAYCCESGTHVIDPAQAYYAGIGYRAATAFHNLSHSDPAPEWDPEAPCMDSTQAWFCRDLWVHAAREGIRAEAADKGGRRAAGGWNDDVGGRGWAHGGKAQQQAGGQPKHVKRELVEEKPVEEKPVDKAPRHVKRADPPPPAAAAAPPPPPAAEKPAAAVPPPAGKDKPLPPAAAAAAGEEKVPANPVAAAEAAAKKPGAAAPIPGTDADANVGSDYDAMPDSDEGLDNVLSRLTIPNAAFRPARILINPRCVTTYAGVSHTQLARDLFGGEEKDDGASAMKAGSKYVLDDWEGAPDSFVCQEQRQTGGRKATKTQRRLSFGIHTELELES